MPAFASLRSGYDWLRQGFSERLHQPVEEQLGPPRVEFPPDLIETPDFSEAESLEQGDAWRILGIDRCDDRMAIALARFVAQHGQKASTDPAPVCVRGNVHACFHSEAIAAGG